MLAIIAAVGAAVLAHLAPFPFLLDATYAHGLAHASGTGRPPST